MHDASRYAPPAPDRPGLLLLAAGGVGIAAVAADLIAVRLRSTALAGLPLLVLFTVPVIMNAPHDQLTTGLGFCLGGAGYLAMLSADGRERIRVWGRLISLWRPAPRYGGFQTPADAGAAFDGALGEAPEPGARHRREGGRGIRVPGPDTRALAAAGRRIGLASIVLALAVPLIVPGLHPSKLFSSGPGIGGTGGGGGRHAGAAGRPVPGRRPAARAPAGRHLHVPDQRHRVPAGQRGRVLQAVRIRHPGRFGLAGRRLHGPLGTAQRDPGPGRADRYQRASRR